MFELFKTIHVLGAIAWVGGVILNHVQSARLGRAQDPRRFRDYAEEQSWLGGNFYAPLSIIVLLSGIVMVIVGWPNFTDAWIIIGLVLFAVIFGIGFGLLKPLGEKINAGLAAEGPPSAEVMADVQRITLLSRADLLLLVLVVINMVVKPGA